MYNKPFIPKFTTFYVVGNDSLFTTQKFSDLLISYMDQNVIKQYTINDLRTMILKELLDITMLLLPSVMNNAHKGEMAAVEYAMKDSDLILHRLDKFTQAFGSIRYIGNDVKEQIIPTIAILLHLIYKGYLSAVGDDKVNSILHYVELDSIINFVWPNFFTLRLRYALDIPF